MVRCSDLYGLPPDFYAVILRRQRRVAKEEEAFQRGNFGRWGQTVGECDTAGPAGTDADIVGQSVQGLDGVFLESGVDIESGSLNLEAAVLDGDILRGRHDAEGSGSLRAGSEGNEH